MEGTQAPALPMLRQQCTSKPVATIGLDIGKNTFHIVGLDKRGAIATRVKVSRSQLVRRLVNSTDDPDGARNLLMPDG